MINIAVVLPTSKTMIGSKSLKDLVEFYKRESNPETSQICKAALACNARAYKLTFKTREFGTGENIKRIKHVSLGLDFDNLNDMCRFIHTYSMLVT